MNEYSYMGQGNAPSYAKKQVELRTCRDCGYATFSKYVACPKCKSEKWMTEYK